MIYLLLSIVCSSLIFLIFRSFTNFNIHRFTAIVFNYLTAACLGFFINWESLSIKGLADSTWLIYALFLGSIFIAMFNVMAITTQRLGASVGSIANKMALIIPVVYAMFFYGDSTHYLKIIGIGIALIGILLSTLKAKTLDRSFNKSDLIFPLILLIGSGFIDTYMKHMEKFVLQDSTEFQLFASATFGTAFLWGAISFVLSRKARSYQSKNISAGVILGLVNFGSIYFLLETFRKSDLESSVIFPFNNVGVVLLTVLLSALFFKEKYSKMNKIGIALSIVAVVLIAISK